MNTDLKAIIGIIIGIAVYLLVAYLINRVIHWLIKVPKAPEQTEQKEPVLICANNSYLGCLLVMLPTALGGGMAFGAVVSLIKLLAGVKEAGLSDTAGGLFACSFVSLIGSAVLWNMIASGVYVFYDGGVVYRNFLWKVRFIPDEEIEYVHVIDYGRRHFINIHIKKQTFFVSQVVTNFGKAKTYVRGKYTNRETYMKRLLEAKEQQEAAAYDGAPEQPEVPKQEEVLIGVKDAQNCLLQQTTTYQRDCPVLFATNAQNELFLVYFFRNTFYIVKAEYREGKLCVAYDYRKKHPSFKGFEYQRTDKCVTAVLHLHGADVEFTLNPYLNYHGMGCRISANQSGPYTEYMDHIEVYYKNINETVEMLQQRPDDEELMEKTKQISREEKREIWELINKGDTLTAIKLIRETTGLGLAECKKIAENYNKYFK